MKKLPFFSLVCLLILACHGAQAKQAKALPGLDSILGDAIKAFTENNYRATLVRHYNRNQLQTMSILHRFSGEGSFEELHHLSGAQRKALRINDVVVGQVEDNPPFFASDGPKRAYSTNPILDKIRRINPSYGYTLRGEDQIAGRNALILEVRARESRYGYYLWVDEASGLVSKLTIVSTQNRLIEQFLMTSLEVLKGEVPLSEFSVGLLKMAQNTKNLTPRFAQPTSPEASPIESKTWQVNWMPRGYVLKKRHAKTVNDYEEMHLLYSDGIASISVVIAKTSPELLRERRTRPRVTLKDGTMTLFDWVNKQHQITVIGEIPKETAEKIARSVAYR